MTTSSHQTCPQCSALLLPSDGYTVWCQQCSWNLQPAQIDVPDTLINRLHLRFGDRLSKRLFDELLASPNLRRTASWSLGMAYILAGIIHAITLACLIGGILFVWLGWPNVWMIAGELVHQWVVNQYRDMMYA